jgi:carbamoyl-phosphate synthase large subunit
VLGVIVQFGGQTPLNLAKGLEENGVRIIGTSPKSIELAEDRNSSPSCSTISASTRPPAAPPPRWRKPRHHRKIGYPSLVRPSFVLGGRAMQIVYSDAELHPLHAERRRGASPDRPVLVDRFLEDATEVDVDCISDGETTVIGAIMEHIEEAGIHSGDSACVIPPFSSHAAMQDRIRDAAKKLARPSTSAA